MTTAQLAVAGASRAAIKPPPPRPVSRAHACRHARRGLARGIPILCASVPLPGVPAKDQNPSSRTLLSWRSLRRKETSGLQVHGGPEARLCRTPRDTRRPRWRSLSSRACDDLAPPILTFQDATIYRSTSLSSRACVAL